MSGDIALETIRGWISTGALLGLLTLAGRLWVQNRKLRMQEKIEDRQGYGHLLAAQGAELKRLSERVASLEEEKARDHSLILELLGTMHRTQAVSILTSGNLSPPLRRALQAMLETPE